MTGKQGSQTTPRARCHQETARDRARANHRRRGAIHRRRETDHSHAARHLPAAQLQNGETDADFIADVILGGHYWAPRWEMEGLFHDCADDRRELRFVADTLDMWDFIERGCANLSAKDRERVAKDVAPFGSNVKFRGFDGSNEASHLGMARFLIEKMDRFSSFKGRDLNAHMPTLNAYDECCACSNRYAENFSDAISLYVRSSTYSDPHAALNLVDATLVLDYLQEST